MLSVQLLPSFNMSFTNSSCPNFFCPWVVLLITLPSILTIWLLFVDLPTLSSCDHVLLQLQSASLGTKICYLPIDYPYFQTLNSSLQLQIGQKLCVYTRICFLFLFINFIFSILSISLCSELLRLEKKYKLHIFPHSQPVLSSTRIRPVAKLLIVMSV